MKSTQTTKTASAPETRTFNEALQHAKETIGFFANGDLSEVAEAAKKLWYNLDDVQQGKRTATASQKTPNSNAYQRKFMRESANLQSTKQMQERQTQAHFNHVEAQRQAGHSPLPWNEKDGIITAGISPGQPYIADCRFGPIENREANAALIVRSVNHATALAEALRLAVDRLKWLAEALPETDSGGIVKVAREALARWEAK